jgi:hypothetical protein
MVIMTRARRGCTALMAATASLLLVAAMSGSAGAHTAKIQTARTSNHCAAAHGSAVHVGRWGGVSHAVKTGCGAVGLSDAAVGTPPLIFHGGPMMGTPATGPVVVTPIYWNPAGHAIPATYKNILNGYLSDVAAASGQHSNVYSTLTEYFGSNGSIRYKLSAAGAVEDTSPFPADGCKLSGQDMNRIYADLSGYDSCLSDDQVTAEIDRIVTTRGLPRDLAHIYVMFLPKHVESCFFGGSTTTAANFCTINHQPSAAYCAYHSQTTQGTVYANMPFPVYASPVGFTCGSDAVFPVVQTPNGDADADTEVSPTSHEIMEAITDPDTATGWYDSSGFENGDECAYVYGTPQGTAGAFYNQVIKKRHYLTQEEFSNNDFFRTGGGCLQSE